jgi:hypothetical protein
MVPAVALGIGMSRKCTYSANMEVIKCAKLWSVQVEIKKYDFGEIIDK